MIYHFLPVIDQKFTVCLRLIFTLGVLSGGVVLSQDSSVSVSSGLWSDPAIWSGDGVPINPTYMDGGEEFIEFFDARINSGDVIRPDIGASVYDLIIDGEIAFNPGDTLRAWGAFELNGIIRAPTVSGRLASLYVIPDLGRYQILNEDLILSETDGISTSPRFIDGGSIITDTGNLFMSVLFTTESPLSNPDPEAFPFRIDNASLLASNGGEFELEALLLDIGSTTEISITGGSSIQLSGSGNDIFTDNLYVNTHGISNAYNVDILNFDTSDVLFGDSRDNHLFVDGFLDVNWNTGGLLLDRGKITIAGRSHKNSPTPEIGNSEFFYAGSSLGATTSNAELIIRNFELYEFADNLVMRAEQGGDFWIFGNGADTSRFVISDGMSLTVEDTNSSATFKDFAIYEVDVPISASNTGSVFSGNSRTGINFQGLGVTQDAATNNIFNKPISASGLSTISIGGSLGGFTIQATVSAFDAGMIDFGTDGYRDPIDAIIFEKDISAVSTVSSRAGKIFIYGSETFRNSIQFQGEVISASGPNAAVQFKNADTFELLPGSSLTAIEGGKYNSLFPITIPSAMCPVSH
ncbi:MAG: hypothetical protein MK080_08150 [Opitutales bacterium]|nr:hypothetical protein [Opitutales bacterium]